MWTGAGEDAEKNTEIPKRSPDWKKAARRI